MRVPFWSPRGRGALNPPPFGRNRTSGAGRASAGYLLFALVAIVVTALAWYVLLRLYSDKFGPTLSANQTVWGEFGEYLGGVLTPVLGTLILLGVLYTVSLQRDLITDARRAERNQRLLNQQQGFENAFFHMLDAINTRAAQATITIMASDLRSQKTVEGPKAFATFIRMFGAQVLLKIRRGDYYGRNENDVLRQKAREVIQAYDHVIGPYLRSVSDLLIFLHDFEVRFVRPDEAHGLHPRTVETTLQRPAFYAGVAMNARTRYEMKVFAMYVGSGLAPTEVARVAHAYRVFDIIEAEWWGRKAFLAS